jgi:hypothetical protein
MRVVWQRSEPPLPAVAVAARGPLGAALKSKVMDRDQVAVTSFVDWSVLEGPDLPWVDGSIYLGELPDARDVLVPVHHRPGLHPDLVRKAALSVLSGQRAERIAVIPHGDQVVVLPLGARV